MASTRLQTVAIGVAAVTLLSVSACSTASKPSSARPTVGTVCSTSQMRMFTVPSASMQPTLQSGAAIAVDETAYAAAAPRRGDIIVIRHALGVPVQSGVYPFLVKRVIGLPGETIESTTDQRIEINGQVLSEPYLP